MSERTEAAAAWEQTRRQYGPDAPETAQAEQHLNQTLTTNDQPTALAQPATA